MPAFFRAVEKLKPVFDWTDKILMLLCKLLLIGDILITAWAVIRESSGMGSGSVPGSARF